MSDAGARERVVELISLILGIDQSQERTLSRDTTPAWDSLRHIEIMLAVEDEFGVSVAEEDFATLVSVDAICAHLRERDATR